MSLLVTKEHNPLDSEWAWHHALCCLAPAWNVLDMRWWYDCLEGATEEEAS